MTHDRSGERERFNLSRFFVDHRQVGWLLLVAMIAWGVAGYTKTAKRKDPEIPVRIGLAYCPWPGITADRVEELVTRKIEQAAAGNSNIEKIESTSRDGVAVVLVHLHDSIADTTLQFADIGQRVTNIPDLPQGAGPVIWVSDFGDTAALMLTVASPKVGDAELAIRGAALRKSIEDVRGPGSAGNHVSEFYCFPSTVSPSVIDRPVALFGEQAVHDGIASAVRPVAADGCVGLDLTTSRSDREILQYTRTFVRERLGGADMHPDAWGPVLVRDPSEAADRLSDAAGDLYSYRQLDDFTHEIERVLQSVPVVAKVSRAGVLPERIFVDYSQERLASAELRPSSIVAALAGRNTTVPGGAFDSGDRHVVVDANVRDRDFRDMENLIVGAGAEGTPVRLRDLATLSRGYESPPRYLNYLTAPDADGRWRRHRAVTLAVQMRSGEQIGRFGQAVDEALAKLRPKFPPDLIVARTSDQPRQVEEKVSLFMISMYEAIAIVVLVCLIAFANWRSALLVAISIPLTLAMTFGAMQMCGIDIQQVSLATLIIALGLLVDMPVLAGDAIQRELADGTPREIAAWMGPTRLARAIFFVTFTNLVAYLPFLMLTGDKGRFLYSLPVVMTITLLAGLIVSLTFIPLVAVGFMRAPKKRAKPIEIRRTSGATGAYARLLSAALSRRWAVLAGSTLLLVAGGVMMMKSKSTFFPKDLSYLSYVDVWLPEDAPLSATSAAAADAERVIREEAETFGKNHGHGDVLKSLTTFVGGAGPRFWFSLEPEQQQLNYAQIVIEVTDKHYTGELVAPLQEALTSRVPGARIDVRQLETGEPVGIPVSIRVSGEDIVTLRSIAGQVADALRSVPIAARVRDNWGVPGVITRLAVDDDRANLSGVTRVDAALSAAAAVSGVPVGSYREGDRQIPIVARLRLEDRSRLSDLSNVYVFSAVGTHSVPMRQVATVAPEIAPSKIQRRNQVRTITVSAYPVAGVLPSEVIEAARPSLDEIAGHLPTGYRLVLGGEHEKKEKGFGELSLVMLASAVLIYFALLFQFYDAVKPLIVFSIIPYAMVGAFAGLAIMGQPFGFMAFLGVASLIGVVVSHAIVLFEFIEEGRERGQPLEEALIDAGIVAARPVLITIAATVLGLVPLAMHGGPLWEPLCYPQIGGLTLSTVFILLLAPVLYAIVVRDLRLIRWDREPAPTTPAPSPSPVEPASPAEAVR